MEEVLYTQELREAVGMPEDAELPDIIGACDGGKCSQGQTPWGICYRCQGKGKMSWMDKCRNHYFDKKKVMRQVSSDIKPEPTVDSKPCIRELTQEEELEWEEYEDDLGLMDL